MCVMTAVDVTFNVTMFMCISALWGMHVTGSTDTVLLYLHDGKNGISRHECISMHR